MTTSGDITFSKNVMSTSRLWRGRFPDGSELVVTAWLRADGREVLEVNVRRPGEHEHAHAVQLIEERL